MEERILLGTILQYPDTFFNLRITEEHFLDSKNKIIFKKIKELFEQGVTPDLLSVSKCSVDVAYISELTNNIAFSNYEYYQDIVIEKAKKYRLGKLMLKIREWARSLTSQEVINNIESEIVEITTDIHTKKIEKVNSLMFETIKEVEKRYNNKGQIPGLSTGMSTLDTFILGLEKSKLYYIGARPSQGKTAVLLNIAIHLAVNKVKVGILSLESGYKQLMMRTFASEGRINSVNISTGYLKGSDFSKLIDVCSRLQNTDLYIYDKPNIDISELKIQTRRMIAMYNIEVLFIDYLQLITGGIGDREHERLAGISIMLKGLAREFDIPIVCLAQLKRDVDNRRPSLGDFSGSSQIEKDADVAILIYHKKENELTKSYFLIEKNRDGPTGVIPVKFEKEYVSFKEIISHDI